MAKAKKEKIEKSEVEKELIKKGYSIRRASELKVGDKLRTGIFALDYVIDGGIFQGEGGHRFEFFGKESSGKTTFSLYIIKKYQELGKKCIFINAEGSYDAEWASKLGIDNNLLDIADPESLEQAGDMLVDFISKYDLIVMDSIPSLITQEELDGTMQENKYMASQAKVMAPMTRKLYSATKQYATTMIFINQLREKVGISYGNPTDTPGGRALKHFYNTRVEFRTSKPIDVGTKEDKDIIGTEVALNCRKNKRGKPYRTAVLDFYFNGYINNLRSLLYSGIKYGLIQKNGGWYQYEKTKEQGEEAFCKSLTKEQWETIETEIWTRMK